MGYALKLYEAFQDLGKDKATILAEFAEYVESRKAATSQELKEAELRLQKEIEGVRLEVEQVRKELKETELGLQKEIEGVRLGLQKEIEKTRADILKWMFIFWASQLATWTGILIGALKWLLH